MPLDRSRFADELARNPTLREKLLAIAAGENLNPAANLAVFETMLNRADMMGTPLALEARTTGERGYYAGYNPKALQNPQTRALLEANLQRALEGSNVSNYATDNSSEGNNRFASRRFASGMYTPVFSAGGEYFSHPSNATARGFRQYPEWRARVEGEGDADPSGAMMANRLKQRMQQVAAQTDGTQPAGGTQVAAARTGTMNDAAPIPAPDMPMPPDEARARIADALLQEANQIKPRTGLELIGGLLQYAAGMGNRDAYNTESREYRTKMRDAMLGAIQSGDRSQLLTVLAANPETANAAAQAMLQATGPKAQEWHALPAQTDAYGRPLPARVINKHTGEIRTVDGAQMPQGTPPAAAPASTAEQPVMPGINVTPPQPVQSAPPAAQGMQYGPPVPKAPEGYVHRRDERGFIYQNGQPVFQSKAELDTEAKKREANQDVIRTNAQGADAFLRGLGRLDERLTAAPEGTFGPVGASQANQTLNRMFGTNEARQQARDMTTQALRDLELSVAQMRMKGQGAITESERQIARETLPSLDKPRDTQQAILKGLKDEAIARLRDARNAGVELPQTAQDLLAQIDAEQQRLQAPQQTTTPPPAASRAATPAPKKPGEMTDDELKRALGF